MKQVLLVSQGVDLSGILGFVNCVRSESNCHALRLLNLRRFSIYGRRHFAVCVYFRLYAILDACSSMTRKRRNFLRRPNSIENN